jgi:hypothetical protein
MCWDKFIHAMGNANIHAFNIFEQQAVSMRLKALNSMRLRWHNGTDYSLDILELLELSRHTFPADAKQNIYGILGLMSLEKKVGIRVDYKLTISQVYANMTALLIDRYHSLDLIVSCSWHETERSQAWLPSWAIDYSASFYGRHALNNPPALCPNPEIAKYGHNAGAGTPISMNFDENA